MNFTVERSCMAKAVKVAMVATSKSKVIPEMTGVLIEVNADKGFLTVTGTDSFVQIQSRLKCEHISEGGLAVFPPIISQMLHLLDGETVEISSSAVENNMANIKSGSCVYCVPLYQVNSFPKISPEYPSEYITVKGINSLIHHTVFATDDSNSGVNANGMQCVKLVFQNGNTTAEAVNNAVAARAVNLHGSDGNLELVLHQSVLDKLTDAIGQKDNVYLGIRDKLAYFITENTVFTALRYMGKTLDVNQVFSRITPEYKATVDSKALYDTISNVMAIFGDNDDRCVNVSVGDGQITVSSKTATGGATASTAATNTVETDPSGFNYNPKWLLDCFKLLTGPATIILDRRGCLLVEANHNRYCVMPRGPVVIRKKETKKPKKTSSKVKAAA